MNIVGVHTEPGPVGWLRCWNWTTQLQGRGHNVKHRPDKSEQFDLETVDDYLRGADVVITCRMAQAKTFAALLAGRHLYGYKLIVDTDDNSDALPSFNFAYTDYHTGAGVSRIARGELREADLVTVSTDHLGEWAKKYAKRVVTIPNCVNPARYNVPIRHKEDRHRDDFRIYWGGGGGHYEDLLILKEPLLQLFHENPRVKLIFSNILPDWAASLPPYRCFFLRFAPWNAYPKVMKWGCFDLALAPLVDNEFNRCKSNIKYLEYAMSGVPGVYQDIKAYESVYDGLTGLKATTPSSWYNKIKLMLDNPILRESIADQARRDVLTRWTLDRWIVKYEKMLKELVGDKPTRPIELSYIKEGDAPEVIQWAT